MTWIEMAHNYGLMTDERKALCRTAAELLREALPSFEGTDEYEDIDDVIFILAPLDAAPEFNFAEDAESLLWEVIDTLSLRVEHTDAARAVTAAVVTGGV